MMCAHFKLKGHNIMEATLFIEKEILKFKFENNKMSRMQSIAQPIRAFIIVSASEVMLMSNLQ